MNINETIIRGTLQKKGLYSHNFYMLAAKYPRLPNFVQNIS